MLRLLSCRQLLRFRPRIAPPPTVLLATVAAAAPTSARWKAPAATPVRWFSQSASKTNDDNSAADIAAPSAAAAVASAAAPESPVIQLWPLPSPAAAPLLSLDVIRLFCQLLPPHTPKYERGGMLLVTPESSPIHEPDQCIRLLAERLGLTMWRTGRVSQPGAARVLSDSRVTLDSLPLDAQPRFFLTIDAAAPGGGRVAAMTLRREGREDKIVSGGVVCVLMEDASEYKRRGAHGYDAASPLVKACLGEQVPSSVTSPSTAAVAPPVHILDSTMGTGVDSFLLASFGARVTMIEQDPILALMMMDGLRRASQISDAAETHESAIAARDIASRLTLLHGDNSAYLRSLASSPVASQPSVIYADPFYPDPPTSQLAIERERSSSPEALAAAAAATVSARSKKSMELARTVWKDRCGIERGDAASMSPQQAAAPLGTSFHPSPANRALHDLLHTALHVPITPAARLILKQPGTPYARRLVEKQMRFELGERWKSRDTVFCRVDRQRPAEENAEINPSQPDEGKPAAVAALSLSGAAHQKKKTPGKRSFHSAAHASQQEEPASSSFPPPASYTLTPIGHLRTVFTDKFSMPRQGCLAKSATAVLTLSPSTMLAAAGGTAGAAGTGARGGGSWAKCVEGLEEFSHVWLIFVFHQHVVEVEEAPPTQPDTDGDAAENTRQNTSSDRPVDASAAASEPSSSSSHRHVWRSTVRPPRLGGSARVGVFASRSPYRPNSIGMSLVKLDAIHANDRTGTVHIHLSGVDLLDGTPVVDLKPYIAYCDSIAVGAAGSEVRVGWAREEVKRFAVSFAASVEQKMAAIQLQIDAAALKDLSRPRYDFRSLVSELVSLDPRHGYQQQRHPACSSGAIGREYGFQVSEWNVRFTMDETGFRVMAVETMDRWRQATAGAKRRTAE